MVYHGKVGLFWGWRQHLYTHSVTLQDGDEDKHFINGQYDHVDFGPHLPDNTQHSLLLRITISQEEESSLSKAPKHTVPSVHESYTSHTIVN